MSIKIMALLLAGLLIHLAMPASVCASSKEEKQVRFVEKTRTNISKLGVGPAAQIQVKLRDKTSLAGFVREVNDASFVVVNSKTGTPTTVAYADVTQVKGHNLSTGAKIAIGIGIGAAVFILLGILLYTTHD